MDSNHSQLEADEPDSNGCYLLVPGDTVCVVSFIHQTHEHKHMKRPQHTHTTAPLLSADGVCLWVCVYTQGDTQICVKWMILLVPCVFSLELTASRDQREKTESVRETLLQMNRKQSRNDPRGGGTACWHEANIFSMTLVTRVSQQLLTHGTHTVRGRFDADVAWRTVAWRSMFPWRLQNPHLWKVFHFVTGSAPKLTTLFS